ncbi:MAG: hypothetical protein HY381_00240 [Candidatus Chisholmbacteria bacterium]|nr:hypothetical protein [Candidatus Chisholmbacteria bacterium]
MNGVNLKPLEEIFPTAKSLLIVTPETAQVDQLAAALGLYVALKEAGKGVTVANPKPAMAEYSRLVGIDQLTQKLGNRNLVISFDYVEEAIEKVSYNVEGGKFNLVIQPKEGVKPIDPQSVNYNFEGSDAQVVFVIGAKTLADLGDLYITEKGVFEKALIVNIDNQLANAKFGQVNLVETASSVSQLVAEMMQDLKLTLSADSAGNLWQGLVAGTQNFQSPTVTADTFEVAAMLLRSGANRQKEVMEPEQGQQFSQVLKQLQPAAPASDWLKPKIYKGSTRV